MDRLAFYLNLTPPTCTSQQKGERVVKGKNGKPFVVHYKKKPLIQAEELFKFNLIKHKPSSPILGPIRVTCEWVFPWRKSERKGVMNKFRRIPKTTKPDAGNSNKLLIDCMTDLGFWNDDSQVFSEKPEKFWGDDVGIYVLLEYGEKIGYVERVSA